ncbi:hypothetical protein GYMLUDRAFT_402826 [Collybiopsis luxurians FD-317 M1]|nr:hypothetical protein GYMLUDRAFT_402826 [Collybiopsis luxurians FD-317 M1]
MAGLLSTLLIIRTHMQLLYGGNHAIKPDISLYSTARGSKPPCQASEMELCAEFKFDPGDEPFRITTGDESDKSLERTSGKDRDIKRCLEDPFECDTKAARETRGQLAVYANAIQASQYRTRTFTVCIRKTVCRLLWSLSRRLIRHALI